MTEKEYDLILSGNGNDQNLIKLVKQEINYILSHEYGYEGIDMCNSREQIDRYIRRHIIPFIDLRELKTRT